MFYVKSDDGKKVDIYGDELYTTCPICGKEFTVDIIELVKNDSDFDICGTSIYCSECSKEKNGNNVVYL